MKHIGLDVGTKTVVLSYEAKGEVRYIQEINGYYVFERANQFVENLLSDPTKVRSDGTARPARWMKHDGRVFVLGRDAEEFAHASNDTLRRPMAEGGITPDEDSMTVLSTIIHSMLEAAEKDLGKFDGGLSLAYCTTAPALNKESNVEYHEKVVEIILSGYETKSKLTVNKLRESHAIVLNESPDGTGIGISWGAGTVTVSFVKFGMEIYSFCWVGSGDWIDEQVAIRHGYNPGASKARGRTARETPTTVSKRKMSLDLSPGKVPADRVDMDLLLHYQVLVTKVVDGIAQGFIDNEASAQVDDNVNVYMAGGTSSPDGFEELVAAEFEKRADLAFAIGRIQKASRPMLTVAEGLLKAAKLH